eukprot:Skav233949  [mRNA]  locus=scaffold1382:161396:163271:- [translate_table: standard]
MTLRLQTVRNRHLCISRVRILPQVSEILLIRLLSHLRFQFLNLLFPVFGRSNAVILHPLVLLGINSHLLHTLILLFISHSPSDTTTCKRRIFLLLDSHFVLHTFAHHDLAWSKSRQVGLRWLFPFSLSGGWCRCRCL